MNNNKIAHISDIHIRFGSRHDEYRTVFNRVISDLEKIKPRRIVITGDIFHLKISLSPMAIELACDFIKSLSKIAPVDMILGNHDLNEKDLKQGNALKPLIDLIEIGYTITSDMKNIPISSSGNGIYFYHDSGFYNIDNDIVYGVYSIWDNEILTLFDKQPNKKYIALYHGAVYGCMSDNGHILKGDELIKVSTFNNFDIVMLGDIHEHQVFERDGKYDVAYAGSLIQQDIGESLDKGYLLWNLDTCEFEKKYIPNDYGFSKITISKGEIWEERLENLKLSFNPKKTKVFVELEDDAENESVEKKSQIRKYIKNKWGCEIVEVEYNKILRNKILGIESENTDLNTGDNWNNLLITFLNENGFEEIDDVIELDKEVTLELNYQPPALNHIEWDLKKMITYNIFSHPAEETVFDFEKLNGIVGIFGKNFSGKSNIIKALIWGLFEKVLGGNVGDNHKVLNLYTGKNNAYVELIIDIAGQDYKIHRGIEVTRKKDGTTKAAYTVHFYYSSEVNGVKKWIDAESDNAATEKKEIKKLILNAIGTFDNFTKISLQTQGGKDDYLSLAQQDKNNLVREYMNLSICDLRYELVNKKFNNVKTLQKNLGNPEDIEKSIQETQQIINEKNTHISFLTKEKEDAVLEIEKHNEEILNLTKKIHKIEIAETNLPKLEMLLSQSNKEIDSIKNSIIGNEDWLSKNFLKEIPEELSKLNKQKLENELNLLKQRFQNEKNTYISLENWLKENQKQNVFPIEDKENEIDVIRTLLIDTNNNLKIANGEKCPTCGHVKHEKNEEQSKILKNLIVENEDKINKLKLYIAAQKAAEKQNQFIDSENVRLGNLKNSLQSTKLDMDRIKLQVDQLSNIDGDLIHNQKVKSTQLELKKLQSTHDTLLKTINETEQKIKILNDNTEKIKENEILNIQIKELQESIKGYKLVNYNLNEQIQKEYGNVKIQENNLENYSIKLQQIKDSVRIYRKYSIYLQAVSRDGIPAIIIRKKLPMVNYVINNILREVVNYKMELFVTPKGDVQEVFYFKEDKTDALPLNLSSGSQKFMGSIAIRDAFHYISSLVKPSFCIIDEGFGTLDDEKTNDINKVFSYLRNKYRLIIIITHRNEIKDCVNHIISVNKSAKGLPQSLIQENPEAGISEFSFT